jgi:hypothetical protein
MNAPLILTLAGVALYLYSRRPDIAYTSDPWPRRARWAGFMCSFSGAAIALMPLVRKLIDQ